MKRKALIITLLIFAAVCAVLPLSACQTDASDTIKAITKPYIAQYECVSATYGEKNFLEDFEYIRVTFIDGEKLEVSYKNKGAKKHVFNGTYKVDPTTREFVADIGILGMKFQQAAILKNGKFTVSRRIFRKQLTMNFEMI